jgi:hypothetical protein
MNFRIDHSDRKEWSDIGKASRALASDVNSRPFPTDFDTKDRLHGTRRNSTNNAKSVRTIANQSVGRAATK